MITELLVIEEDTLRKGLIMVLAVAYGPGKFPAVEFK